LVLIAYTLSSTQSIYLNRFCWSIMFISAMEDLTVEGREMYGCIVLLKRPGSYFARVWTYIDIMAILFSTFFLTRSMNLQFNEWPKILSLIVLARWVQFIYSFRAYRILGTNIIPILHSFFKIGNMTLITLFCCLGFTHAFLTYDDRPITEQVGVVIGTSRFLFADDDKGIDTILQLGAHDGEEPETWFTAFIFFGSVFFFNICLLNIFIAVHGEAYRKSRQKSVVSFQQERARICVQYMMLLNWKWGRLQRPRFCAFAILSVAMIVWASLLNVVEVPLLVPSLLMFFVIALTNAILAQQPWQGDPGEHFLWWCVRVDKTLNDSWRKLMMVDHDDSKKRD